MPIVIECQSGLTMVLRIDEEQLGAMRRQIDKCQALLAGMAAGFGREPEDAPERIEALEAALRQIRDMAGSYSHVSDTCEWIAEVAERALKSTKTQGEEGA